MQGEQQGDVGQRPDGHQRHGLFAGEQGGLHGFDGMHRQQLLPGLGKLVTIEAGVAVDMAGIVEGAHEGLAGPLCHRHLFAEKVQQAQGVAGGLADIDIAGDRGDERQLDPGVKQGGGDGNGIVDAGVGVQNNGGRVHAVLLEVNRLGWHRGASSR